MDTEPVNYVLSAGLWNGVFLAAGLIGAVLVRKQFNATWFIISVVLFNFSLAIVLDAFHLNDFIYGLIGSPDVQFNWAGKGVMIVFSILILLSPLVDRREAGVTLRQSGKAYVGWGVFLALVALDAYIALQIETEPYVGEAIAYQLTMPSLDEELFHRGVLLFALMKAFGQGPRILFANFGWGAVISVVLFTIIHCLFWAGGLVFSMENFLFAGMMGVLLTWLRLNTGSILAPILLHSVVNSLVLLI